MKILVINPGSTSTKWAVYEDRELLWKKSIQHPASQLKEFPQIIDQLEMRTEATRQALAEANIPIDFDVVIARGGLLRPTPSGVYEVNDLVAHDLEHSQMSHACNLGGLISRTIAGECNCPALIADPEVVDELMPEARITGLPHLRRKSIFHALNTKAVARRYAASVGRNYEDMNFIMVHLGGGISVGAHLKGQVVDVNNALNGDGPFSPERAGSLPTDGLVEMCYSGRYTLKQMKQMLNGAGGLTAHLNTTDVETIARRAEKGKEPYRSVLDAMLYNVAKEVGARAVALKGEVDAIILTGGIAHSTYCVEGIRKWIEWIGPIIVRAGEDELDALAFNAYGAMNGTIPYATYNPKDETDPEQSDRRHPRRPLLPLTMKLLGRAQNHARTIFENLLQNKQ